MEGGRAFERRLQISIRGRAEPRWGVGSGVGGGEGGVSHTPLQSRRVEALPLAGGLITEPCLRGGFLTP